MVTSRITDMKWGLQKVRYAEYEGTTTKLIATYFCLAIRDKHQNFTGYFFIDVAVIQSKS